MNNFQFKIFQEINKTNNGNNIMISPLSIYHILSLTTNGAEKKTLDEMVKTLCHKSIKEMNKNNLIISSVIKKFKSMVLANAVFTRFKPENPFVNIVKEYHSKMELLKDANQINKWCSDSTHKKIQYIIDSLSEDDKMVLINAIYFKGVWQKKFDKSETHKNSFMNFNKKSMYTDFMNISENFDYFENKDIQAISLNYQYDDIKAFIILPKRQDINTYIKSLTSENYYNILKNLENKKVILSLPKFEINFGEELKPHFISLGMLEPFNISADFSSMRKGGSIKIGRIIHKSFIKVDEEGTKAATITAVVMTDCIKPRNDTIMNINHPFLFIIRSDYLPHGHDILFIAKIESLDYNTNSNEIKKAINISNKPVIKFNILKNDKIKPISINKINLNSQETNKKSNEINNNKIIIHPPSAASKKIKNNKGEIKISTNNNNIHTAKNQINKNIKINKESVLNQSKQVLSKIKK